MGKLKWIFLQLQVIICQFFAMDDVYFSLHISLANLNFCHQDTKTS